MLKHYLLLLPGLGLALAGRAQTPRQTIKPPLTNVTVYLNGTELEHRAPVTLVPGLNRIFVAGLSYKIDTESLEVELGGDAELLSVGDDEDEAPTTVAVNRTAVDSLTRAEDEQRTLEGELLGLQQEKSFLLANQVLPAGTQANWSAEVLKGATLMRTRLAAISLETNRLTNRQKDLQSQMTRLRPRASETGRNDLQVLLVRAPRALTVPLKLSYQVSSRMPWRPQLDIRADDAGREIQFITKGILRNQSGLDWQKVRVLLLRYGHDEDVSRPDMEPWELDFDGGSHGGEGRIDQYVVKGTAKGKPVEVSQGSRYEVPEPVSLPAGGRRDLTLPSLRLAGRPEYLAVPRMSEHVFLQTKVSGWEGLQLPDKASVYHQGVYVGETELDDRAFNDSLEVALGHDEQLVVSRAKLEDFSSNVPLSEKRRVRLAYELNVLNRHTETVRLRLVDQVPIAEEKEINVKVLETSGAELDERSGKLTWVITLPPGTNKRVRFAFQVDYPKDKKVEIIKHSAPVSKNPKFR